MPVQMIKYSRSNAMDASGGKVEPGIVEYESGKFFNITLALKQDTTVSKVSGDGFMVDGEKEKELVKALDKHPSVYRAGGESAGSAGASFD